jgi:hypothetical protein
VAQPHRGQLSDEDRLRVRASSDMGICPSCGGPIGARPQGTGQNDDGRYCSLECLARTLYELGPTRGDEGVL